MDAPLKLTEQNFKNGFLVDDEWMGSVIEESGTYSACVLSHATGEALYFEPFETLPLALDAINRLHRPWAYESLSGCGACAEGTCTVEKGGKCKKLAGGAVEAECC